LAAARGGAGVLQEYMPTVREIPKAIPAPAIGAICTAHGRINGACVFFRTNCGRSILRGFTMPVLYSCKTAS